MIPLLTRWLKLQLRNSLVRERSNCLHEMERIAKEGHNHILSDWTARNFAVQAKIERIDRGILG